MTRAIELARQHGASYQLVLARTALEQLGGDESEFEIEPTIDEAFAALRVVAPPRYPLPVVAATGQPV